MDFLHYSVFASTFFSSAPFLYSSSSSFFFCSFDGSLLLLLLSPPLLAQAPLVLSLGPGDTGALWEADQGQGAGSVGRSTCTAAARHHECAVVTVPTGGRRCTPAWKLVIVAHSC